MTALLSVKNLTVEFTTRDGIAPVIDDLSFDLAPGETLSLVGESGCGKSMTALAIMGLIPSPPGRVASGSISLAGENLLHDSPLLLRLLRQCNLLNHRPTLLYCSRLPQQARPLRLLLLPPLRPHRLLLAVSRSRLNRQPVLGAERPR